MGGLVMTKYYNTYNLPEVTVTAINPNRLNNNMHQFIQGVNSMHNNMMRKYNLSDNDWVNISKQAVNLTGVETKNGTSLRYWIKEHIPDSGLKLMQKLTRGKVSPISRGLTQIKIYHQQKELNSQYRKYGINENSLKSNPALQGKATVLKLLYNRQTMKPSYTWKDGSPMSQTDANSIYWNRGKLTSGKNDRNDPSNNGVQYIKKYNDRSIIR